MKDAIDPLHNAAPDDVIVERGNGISVLRFNRPDKKNAITGAMYEALTEGLREAEADKSVRVHVFLGQPGVFTAGNDIQDFVTSATEQDGLGREVLGFLDVLTDTTKPLIAGVDGLAVGIGATLLLHCDLVYATADSMLTTPFTALGLVPEAASSLIGPRLLGHQRAFELLALGERWSGEQACRAGLVNDLVASTELERHVLSIAGALADRSPESVLETRRLLRGDVAECKQRIADEAEVFSRLLKSDAAQAAFARFINK